MLDLAYRSLLVLLLAYFCNVVYQIDIISISNLILACCYLALLIKFSKSKSMTKLVVVYLVMVVVWGVITESLPFSDFLVFKNHSVELSRGEVGGIFESKSPVTILYFASVIRILGESHVSFYFASGICWSMGSLLLYFAIKRIEDIEEKDSLLLAIFLFSPAIILYGVVISTESVYFLLTSALLWLFSFRNIQILGRFHLLITFLMLGVGIGLLFLVRSVAIILLIAILVSLVLFKSSGKVRLQAYMARLSPIVYLSIGFSAVLILYSSLSYLYTGEFRVNPSKWGAYNLMVGTNKDSSGGYSESDLELAGFKGDNKVNHEEASRNAIRIAKERILSDKGAFLSFALTGKVVRLWGGQSFAYRWSTGNTYKPDLSDKVYSFVKKLLDASYLLIILGFLSFLVITLVERKVNYISFFVGIAMFGYILLHLFVEVQGRYHLSMYPFMLYGAYKAVRYIENRVKLNSLSVN